MLLGIILLPFVLMGAGWVLWYSFVPPKNQALLTAHELVLRRRLHVAGVVTLVAGLMASGVVAWKMRAVPEQDDDIIGYDLIDGKSYPIRASDTKRHDLEMEKLQGKAGIAMTEWVTWLKRRFQGHQLAPTLAALSVVALVGFFFLARYLTPPPESRA